MSSFTVLVIMTYHVCPAGTENSFCRLWKVSLCLDLLRSYNTAGHVHFCHKHGKCLFKVHRNITNHCHHKWWPLFATML